jgi:hypothetical protein
MTPREKAKEIINKYLNINLSQVNDLVDGIRIRLARDCALITVNEVIEQWEYIDTYLADLGGKLNPNLRYWYEVKNEIENYKYI